MAVSREALSVTNPKARYIVLTDKETAPYLEKDFEVEALAPSRWPLMRQYVEAQRAYEAKAEPGLTVLAATDCVAQLDLSDALQHSMAITYRDRGRNIINNIAYVHDHDKAAWFLGKALGLMHEHQFDFWGDQQSWEDALGDPETWEHLDDNHEGIRVAKPEGHPIHLYPCVKYNYFPKRSGALSLTARKAYILHYKGPRKNIMVESVRWHILKNLDNQPDWNNLKEVKQSGKPLPMEERRYKT